MTIPCNIYWFDINKTKITGIGVNLIMSWVVIMSHVKNSLMGRIVIGSPDKISLPNIDIKQNKFLHDLLTRHDSSMSQVVNESPIKNLLR